MGVNTIDNAFVKQFETDVHLAYQRMGSKLLNTVRLKSNITGESTTFQTMGTGTAGTKARNGQVPIMNLGHTPVECTLGDYYAGEFVDKLDELKIQHDEKQVVATSIAAALGRKSDALLIAAAETASNSTATAGALTQPKVEEIFEFFGNNDVPDDGQRFMPVAPQGWTDLVAIDGFSNADYVGANEANLPFTFVGMTMKRWLSFNIFTFSGLSKAAAIRTSMAYHKSALGHASGADVYLDITWQGKEQAHLLVGGMSQGSCLIDDNGVYLLKHTES